MKANRVPFGLLKPAEIDAAAAAGNLPRSRRFLAVPFVGKDAPSPSSEYAHPDVAIGLSYLAYRFEGLRKCARDLAEMGRDEDLRGASAREISPRWAEMKISAAHIAPPLATHARLVITPRHVSSRPATCHRAASCGPRKTSAVTPRHVVYLGYISGKYISAVTPRHVVCWRPQ